MKISFKRNKNSFFADLPVNEGGDEIQVQIQIDKISRYGEKGFAWNEYMRTSSYGSGLWDAMGQVKGSGQYYMPKGKKGIREIVKKNTGYYQNLGDCEKTGENLWVGITRRELKGYGHSLPEIDLAIEQVITILNKEYKES